MRGVRLPAPLVLSLLLLGSLGSLGSLGCASLPQPAPLRQADAIVVLGNRPPVDEQGRVRPETRARVEAGVRAYRQGLAPVLLMTGGPAPSGAVEAEVMRALAIELGVPAEAILTEPRSSDTIDNARFSMALLCEGEAEPCIPAVIVVTSPYHLERAGRLFECAGARVQLAPAEVPTTTAHRLREGSVRLYYGLIDECRRAAPPPSP